MGEPKPPAPTTKRATDAADSWLEGSLKLCSAFPPCMLGVVAVVIVTSPIWVPLVIVGHRRQRASLKASLDASLQAGNVVLAPDHSASAEFHFLGDSGEAASLATAFLVLRVSDEVERDWAAKVPLVVPSRH